MLWKKFKQIKVSEISEWSILYTDGGYEEGGEAHQHIVRLDVNMQCGIFQQ